MQAVPFKRQPRAVMMAVLLVAGAALAFALLSSGTGSAQAKVHHHAKHHARHHSEPVGDTDNVQSGDQTSPDPSGAASATEPTGGPDTDNVQSGDQTGGTDPSGGASATEPTGGPDTDNVQFQSGDQTGGPDTDNVQSGDQTGSP